MPPATTPALRLPERLAAAVRDRARAWDRDDRTRRLWDGDAKLWTGRDEASWLGWLRIAARERATLSPVRDLADAVAREEVAHAVLLGMGGSSLGPEVLQETFGAAPGRPGVQVLDSTDPGQIAALERRIDPARTLFIVSSKSGTTLEPNIFKAYFFDRVRAAGAADPGARFVAITDPGSALEGEARRDRFRAVFHGEPSIGGRYSVLSRFGVVPAAIAGIDVDGILASAVRMGDACAPAVAAADNPGVLLGIVLGTAAAAGIDKLTFATPPSLRDLGAWLEQLIAESTGKEGKGIIPVDRERVGPPEAYGTDRLFVDVRLREAPDPEQEHRIEALARAGAPVVRIDVASRLDLGGEFLRWEIATAVAGSILGIDPFDQPDVEASKVATRALTDAFEREGRLPAEPPLFESGGVRVYADAANAAALRAGGEPRDLAGWLRAHVARLRPSDYAALLAYVPMEARTEAVLQEIRHRIRDARRVATCLGFGPRFLHSTGQAYKGGPNSGVFLMITCDDAADLPVPGRRATFGAVKAAQARGDFQVLAERGRRLLRVHLGADVVAGLRALDGAVRQALGG